MPFMQKEEQIYLSRRNLLILLSKLDRKGAGEATHTTIIKSDDVHPIYPQSMPVIRVTAVEDDDYYALREAGAMHPTDEGNITNN
jgi:hypothetical protein